MTEAKTQMTETPVEAFLAAVEPPAKREDARVLDAMCGVSTTFSSSSRPGCSAGSFS